MSEAEDIFADPTNQKIARAFVERNVYKMIAERLATNTVHEPEDVEDIAGEVVNELAARHDELQFLASGDTGGSEDETAANTESEFPSPTARGRMSQRDAEDRHNGDDNSEFPSLNAGERSQERDD